MSNPNADAQQIRIKRHLRMRIGRLRRRVNSRLRGSQREGQRLLSWRTYVKRYPGGALAAAFGVGMATSTGLKGPRLIRAICALLVRRGTGTMLAGVRDELLRVWKESTPSEDPANADSVTKSPNNAGVDDGR